MKHKTRRGLLASAGLVLLAGCSSEDTDEASATTPTTGDTFDSSGFPDQTPTSTPEPFDASDFSGATPTSTPTQIDLSDIDFPTEAASAASIVDDTDTVSEDAYLYWEFTLGRETSLQLRTTVRSGPAIDMIFTNPEELRQFENGNRFRYNSTLSQMDTIGDTTTGQFQAGDYVLILDNTSAGVAEPPTNFDDDAARVDVLLQSE